MRTQLLLGSLMLAALLAGCGGGDPSTPGGTGGAAGAGGAGGGETMSCDKAGLPPLDLDKLGRIVTLGDGIATNPSHARCDVALLFANDDQLFPDFAGHDLKARVPGIEAIRLDSGGAFYRSIGEDPAVACKTFAGCVDPSDTRPALLLLQLGANDLISMFITLNGDASLEDDLSPLLDPFRESVRQVLAITRDPKFFAKPPAVVVVGVPDPSDGVGNLADLAEIQFGAAGQVSAKGSLALLAGVNDVLRTETEGCGALFVDAQAAFLGHGFNAADPASPHYHAEDPSLWMRSLVEPNLRGAHELRRAIWQTLTGEKLSALPMNLPVEPKVGELPMISDPLAWANAVVKADLTKSITSPDGIVWTNVATDPSVALGPAGGSFDAVALGVLGAYLVLDLGAGEEATDGPGDDLVVYEQGPKSGGSPEPFRVLVGNDPAGPFTPLGDGFAERPFDLAGSGVSSARYVRIESLRIEADVFRWPGSPTNPGPEIDAVGVVHLP